MKHTKKPLPATSFEAQAGKGSASIVNDDLANLKDRLSRYYTAKKRATVNRSVLRSEAFSDDQGTLRRSKYLKASSGLSGCGNYLVFHHYFTANQTRLAKASFCKQHLICPLCAIRRGSKTLKSYLERYSVIMSENPAYRLSMITLTVQNGTDLKERFEHLQKSQKKLFDRRRDWLKKGWGKTEFRKIHGWVGTHEVTNKGNGWHPHSHIMVLHSSNFDYSNLIQEWKDITGDSCNLNVSGARHPSEPERDFIEVFKYAVKFSDLTPEQNIHAWSVLSGKRLLFSGGCFRGVKVPESMTDDLLDDLEYIELFYKLGLSGYDLAGAVVCPPSGS